MAIGKSVMHFCLWSATGSLLFRCVFELWAPETAVQRVDLVKRGAMLTQDCGIKVCYGIILCVHDWKFVGLESNRHKWGGRSFLLLLHLTQVASEDFDKPKTITLFLPSSTSCCGSRNWKQQNLRYLSTSLLILPCVGTKTSSLLGVDDLPFRDNYLE